MPTIELAKVSGKTVIMIVKMVLAFPNPNQNIAKTIQIIGGIESNVVITGFKNAAKLLYAPATSPSVIPMAQAVPTPTSERTRVMFISLFL